MLQDGALLSLRQCCEAAVKRLEAAVETLESLDETELGSAVEAYQVGLLLLAARRLLGQAFHCAGCGCGVYKLDGRLSSARLVLKTGSALRNDICALL